MTNKIRSRSFYKALLAFMQKAFELVNKKASNASNFSTMTQVKVSRGVDLNQTELKEISQVNWSAFILTFRNELTNLDEYKNLLKVISRNKTISRHLNTLVGTTGFQLRFELSNFLERVLVALLTYSPSAFSLTKFRESYNGIEGFFYNNNFTYRYIAPIKNFKSDKEKIQIGENLFIIKLTDKDFEDLHSYTALFSNGPENIFHRSDYAFVYECEVRKVIGESKHPSVDSQQKVTEIFDNLCSVLRLLKPGNLNYNTVYPRPTSWTFFPQGFSSFFTDRQTTFGATYHLEKNDIAKLLKLWNEYKKYMKIKTSGIDLAMRRFGFGYNRMRQEDRLIDYLISFEALVLPSDRQELSFKLALRTSMLVAKNIRQRTKVFALMKKAYNIRSQIVHGAEIKLPIIIENADYNLKELIDMVESSLRSAIINFIQILKTKKKHSEVISFLDNKAISAKM